METSLNAAITMALAFLCLPVTTPLQARSVESEALSRFRGEHRSSWSNDLPADPTVGMSYMPIQGLGPDDGIVRRDPSDVVKIGDLYHLWYTRSAGGPLAVGPAKATASVRAYPWDLADIWMATSPDGINWTEVGPSVKRGPDGSYDARSVFTPNILVAEGKYYLFYQTAPNLDDPDPGDFKWTKIGMSWADSPYGPWHRAERPVLSHGHYGDPGNYPDGPINEKGDWDGLVAHDPSLIYLNGKYLLYYKSRYFRGQDERFSEGDLKDWVEKEGGIPIGWGVATVDRPEGPYMKSELNPVIIGGHECIVWPHDGGVCALVAQGPERNTIQFSKDGLNFHSIGSVAVAPIAAGIYRPDFSITDKPDSGNTWGISHVVQGVPWHYLRRFEFDSNLAN